MCRSWECVLKSKSQESRVTRWTAVMDGPSKLPHSELRMIYKTFQARYGSHALSISQPRAPTSGCGLQTVHSILQGLHINKSRVFISHAKDGEFGSIMEGLRRSLTCAV